MECWVTVFKSQLRDETTAPEGMIEPRSRFAEGSNWIRFNAMYDTKQFDVDVDASGGFRVCDALDGFICSR